MHASAPASRIRPGESGHTNDPADGSLLMAPVLNLCLTLSNV